MQRVDVSNFKNKKVALVLSGGVVKAAAWHVGVALALDELGFVFKHNASEEKPDYEISTYVGSSAGSMINLYFASGYRPIDIIESLIGRKATKLKPISYSDMLSIKRARKKPPKNQNYNPFDGLPFYVQSLLKPFTKLSGFFTTQGLYNYIIENVLIGEKFEDYKADLFVVATQLDHSRKVIFSKYNYPNPSHDSTSVYYTDYLISDTVAASMSVPPFYCPHPIISPKTNQLEYYIDGEIRETLSTHVATDNNCEFVISSWTHTPYHYHDEIGSLINYGLPAICLQAIHLIIQKKIVSNRAHRNNASDVINTVHDYMNTHKFSNNHISKVCNILERKLNFKPHVHLIDVYPKHDNYKMFFQNSFSLDPNKTSELVSMGFKRTMEVFKNHEWES